MPITTPQKKLPQIILLASLLLPLLSACNNSSNDSNSSEALPHLNRADTYAEQGQYRSAILEIRNAIQVEPDNVAHIVRLAEIYLELGANQQTIKLLEPWLKDAPKSVALPLARAYVAVRKHLSAIETLALANPATNSEKLEAELITAEALRQSGKVVEAIAVYRGISKKNPTNEAALIGLANGQFQLRDPAAALITVNSWLADKPTSASLLHLKGTAQYQLRDLEPAAVSLTAAVTQLPASDIFLPLRGEILTLLSRVLTAQGKIDEAQVYNRILAEQTDPGSRQQSEAIISAIQAGKFDDAKIMLRDMRKLDPNNELLALMLGTLAASTGELEEGAELLSENLDPETSPTRFIRASTMAQIDMDKRVEALATLDRAVKARPNDNDLLAMHGILALSIPEHANQGVASVNKAINNQPDRLRLRFALARHHLEKQEPELALGHLRIAFATNPADWVVTSTYLNTLIDQGEHKEAREIRDALINGYGNEREAVLIATMADTRLGNFEAARTALTGLKNNGFAPAKSAYAELLMAETEAAVAAGNWTQARSKAAEAIALQPNNIRFALQPVAIAELSGDMTGAITALDSVEATHGKDIASILVRTDLLRKSKGDKTAHDYLRGEWRATGQVKLVPSLMILAKIQAPETLDELSQLWVEATPKNPTALLARADLLMSTNRHTEAQTVYKNILGLTPQNTAALNNLAWLLRESDPTKALALAKRATELAPKNASILDTYGWILHLSGNHPEAKELIQQALKLAPNSQNIKKHLKAVEKKL
ncbi:tetratricopeptide repeat protein [Marinobacter sp. M3C]|jgi:tetratricopeptide (TPR) repeat protein|uniref:tetratricopeptide repeat protein n=1 Tax=Marinobacter sp. M3C TaxID=2917715 RepID=UPI00200ECF4B|nr:tetratricopeptide repeat protein [Marinobacter sp. M3C]UQG60440.1 tetratricopeptide repeat protein [Marinobacter sp. M3C]